MYCLVCSQPKVFSSSVIIYLTPYYPFLPPPTPFPSGNPRMVVCVYDLKEDRNDGVSLASLFLSVCLSPLPSPFMPSVSFSPLVLFCPFSPCYLLCACNCLETDLAGLQSGMGDEVES